MKAVPMGASPGSNQAGTSVTWTAQVTWPSGPASAGSAAPIARSRTSHVANGFILNSLALALHVFVRRGERPPGDGTENVRAGILQFGPMLQPLRVAR